jgi:hypothetical protein
MLGIDAIAESSVGAVPTDFIDAIVRLSSRADLVMHFALPDAATIAHHARLAGRPRGALAPLRPMLDRGAAGRGRGAVPEWPPGASWSSPASRSLVREELPCTRSACARLRWRSGVEWWATPHQLRELFRTQPER